jgi:hypothetical protein
VLGHFEDEVERGLKRVKIVHEDEDEGNEGGEIAGSVDGRMGSDVEKND